ncbi:MAG: ATP-binding cassette domain-containing protein [Flavisolibacter sp.]|jgi:phospholipid/cholesterol/gamma-HCH transport system ATP-binding protein|nr:ATP-binding cassette domain-containing protein [Flavisolibacter sp.]
MRSQPASLPLAPGKQDQTVIEVKDLNKAFGDNKVLQGFNLELKKGENLVVLGKSGSGKSVLIKCIIGLLAPDKGSIHVLGESIPDLNESELDKIRVQIGFLFQSNALYDSMTVRDNLEFPLRRHWMQNATQDVDEMVMEALSDVGLVHTVDMMPIELSGGMRKRIALARTLILKPGIILYDEPTTGLDPITAREISELIVDIQKKYKASSLIITHDMRCVEITADRVIILVNGRCYATGSFEELKRSTDPQVKHFFD